jgi:putative molybdopterin biosynthesis protein
VTEEPYDLVLDAATLDDPVVAPLLELLADAAFREAIVAMGGYSTRETGRRIR